MSTTPQVFDPSQVSFDAPKAAPQVQPQAQPQAQPKSFDISQVSFEAPKQSQASQPASKYPQLPAELKSSVPNWKPGDELPEDEPEDRTAGTAFWDNEKQNQMAAQYNQQFYAAGKKEYIPPDTVPQGLSIGGGTITTQSGAAVPYSQPPSPAKPQPAPAVPATPTAPPVMLRSRTGTLYPAPPPSPVGAAIKSVVTAPITGVQDIAHGVQQVVEAGSKVPLIVGGTGYYQPPQPDNPEARKEAAAGLTNVIGGAMKVASPLAVAGAVAAPVSTLVTLGAGTVADLITQKGLKAAGVAPEYADLAGTIASVLAGYGAAHVKLSPDQQTLVQVLKGATDGAGGGIEDPQVDALRRMVDDQNGNLNERVLAQQMLKRKFGVDHGPDLSQQPEPAQAQPQSQPTEPAKPEPATPPAAAPAVQTFDQSEVDFEPPEGAQPPASAEPQTPPATEPSTTPGQIAPRATFAAPDGKTLTVLRVTKDGQVAFSDGEVTTKLPMANFQALVGIAPAQAPPPAPGKEAIQAEQPANQGAGGEVPPTPAESAPGPATAPAVSGTASEPAPQPESPAEAPAVEPPASSPAPVATAPSETPAEPTPTAPPATSAEQPHEFSSTQANITGPIADAVQSFAAKIPTSQLAPEAGGTSGGGSASTGIEKESHITALYGLETDDPAPVQQLLANQPPITVTLGNASVFHTPEADVLKVDVHSPELHVLNATLATLPHTSTHPEYIPHLTIAYLAKGQGDQYEGQAIPGVTGQQVTLNSIAFSGKDGKQTEIPLTGRSAVAAPAVTPEEQKPESPAPAAQQGTESAPDIQSQIDAHNQKATDLMAQARKLNPRARKPLLDQAQKELDAAKALRGEAPAANPPQQQAPQQVPPTPKKSAANTQDERIIAKYSGQPIETKLFGTIPKPLPQPYQSSLRGKPDHSLAAAQALKGGFYESYGGGIDQITDVDVSQGFPTYTVKDANTGEVHRHQTFIDPRVVTFQKESTPATQVAEPTTQVGPLAPTEISTAPEKSEAPPNLQWAIPPSAETLKEYHHNPVEYYESNLDAQRRDLKFIQGEDERLQAVSGKRGAAEKRREIYSETNAHRNAYAHRYRDVELLLGTRAAGHMEAVVEGRPLPEDKQIPPKEQFRQFFNGLRKGDTVHAPDGTLQITDVDSMAFQPFIPGAGTGGKGIPIGQASREVMSVRAKRGEMEPDARYDQGQLQRVLYPESFPFQEGDHVRWRSTDGSWTTGVVEDIPVLHGDHEPELTVAIDGAVSPNGSRIVRRLRFSQVEKTGAPAPEADTEQIVPAAESEQGVAPIPKGAPALIEAVYRRLKSGGSLGNVTEFNKMAEESYGSSRTSGQWSPKDAFDAMEAGVNRYLLDEGKRLMELPPEEALRELKALEARLTSQGVRTDEQIKAQQFSTPPRESYVASRVAGVTPEDVFLEPSAGNGGLAVWSKAQGAETYVNEISDRRQQMLHEVGFDHVTAVDGEVINALLDPSIKPTVIVMNPPFSSGALKSGPARNNNQYGFNHVDQALQRLAPGGRLVAILGGGRADDLNGGATLRGGPSGRWFGGIAKQYRILANVRVNGKEYQKYGTNFATRIIVIDKTGPTPAEYGGVIEGAVDTLEEAYNLLRDVGPRSATPRGNAERPGAAQTAGAKTATGNLPGEGTAGIRGGELGPASPGASAGLGLRPGEPAPNGPGVSPELAGQQAGGVQPRPEPAKPPEAGAPRTGEGNPPSADFGRAPVPGAADLAGAAGLTPQQLIEQTIRSLQESGVKPVAGTAQPVAEQPPPAAPSTPPPTAPSPSAKPSTPFDQAASDALKRLQARHGKKSDADSYPASLQSRVSPTENKRIDPADIQDLMLIGAQQIMGGANTYSAWAGKMNEVVGDLVGNIAEQTNGSPDQILRTVYALAGQATQAFGVTPEVAPPAAESPSPTHPLTGNEFDNTPLKLDRELLPKSEQEDTAAYVTYRPTIKGPQHPGDIVETKTMATIPLPAITYQPNLPQSVIDNGLLSAVQLEAIALARQQNEIVLPDGTRACALIGDGTGVGKGRIGAGFLWDNWRNGRRRLMFVSEKWDLMQDILRDLSGIGASDLTQGIERGKNGEFRTTKTSRMQQMRDFGYGDKIKHEGIIFSSYGTVRAENSKGARRDFQISEWLAGDDDGEGAVLVLDESHNLKNAVVGQGGEASQIGVKMREILKRVPKLRILPMSATAATDVMNLGYLDRLGIWGPGTPFPTGFSEFASNIAANGLSAMEMIARELKAQGKYISRTLSFKGVTYLMDGDAVHQLSPEQKKVYRTASRAWRSVVQEVEHSISHTTNGGSLQKSRFMAQFGAAQQRFFGLLITALKTPTCLELAQKALADGKSVIISLVNTNEALQNREKARVAAEGNDEEIPDYDFGPKRMLTDLVKEHYPTQQYVDDVDDSGNPIKRPLVDDKGNPVQNPTAVAARDALLAKLDKELNMPENPLDILINSLGGSGAVAEMTGRKERFDSSTGKFIPRGGKGVPAKDVNVVEMKAFQDGKKRVALLSGAAGTGITLSSDLKAKNQQVRYHIILQPGWSADKVQQMLGRSHRTNQAHPPEYVFIVSDLAGEKRFMSTIARRLGSLGALTKGQQNAMSGTDMMEKVNFETDQGKAATRAFYEALLRNIAIPGTANWADEAPAEEQEKAHPSGTPVMYRGPDGERVLATAVDPLGAIESWQDREKPVKVKWSETDPHAIEQIPRGDLTVRLPEAHRTDEPLTGMTILRDLRMLSGQPPTVPLNQRQNVTKLLNRLMAIDPDDQSGVYNFYYDIFQATIQKAMEDGTLDTGVKTLPGDSFDITQEKLIATDPKTAAQTFHYVVKAAEKANRVDAEGLRHRIAVQSDEHPAIFRSDKGKLVLAINAPPIVHANGRTDEARYISSPGNGKWVKTPRAQIRGKEVEEWATEEREKAQSAVDDAEWRLRRAEEDLKDAEEYHRMGPVQDAERKLKTAEAKLFELQNPPAPDTVIYAGSKYSLLYQGGTRRGERAKIRSLTSGREIWVSPGDIHKPQRPTDLPAAIAQAQSEIANAKQNVEHAQQEAGRRQLPADDYRRTKVAEARETLANAQAALEQAHTVAGSPRDWAMAEWQKQFDSAPSHIVHEHHLLGGAVMKYWNAITDATGGHVNNIYTTADSKTGKRVVGVEIPPESIGRLVQRIGGGGSLVNAHQFVTDILSNNMTYRLEGGIQARRTNINRRPVIQLIPLSTAQGAALRQLGVLYEQGVTPVYYLPNNETFGGAPSEDVAERVLRSYPVQPESPASLESRTIPGSWIMADGKQVPIGQFASHELVARTQGKSESQLMKEGALRVRGGSVEAWTPQQLKTPAGRRAMELAARQSPTGDVTVAYRGPSTQASWQTYNTPDLEAKDFDIARTRPGIAGASSAEARGGNLGSSRVDISSLQRLTDAPEDSWLSDIGSYWSSAQAAPTELQGVPTLLVNNSAMDVILNRMGNSSGMDPEHTTGLALRPHEWRNVLAQASTVAGAPRPGGFDNALIGIADQLRKLTASGPGEPVIVLQTGGRVSGEMLRTNAQEELDHVLQMRLPGGLAAQPVELLNKPLWQKAQNGLTRKGYKEPTEGSPHYDNDRAVMTAEIAVRLMRGRYNELNVTAQEARDMAAEYAQSLVRDFGDKANEIVNIIAQEYPEAEIGGPESSVPQSAPDRESGPRGREQLPEQGSRLAVPGNEAQPGSGERTAAPNTAALPVQAPAGTTGNAPGGIARGLPGAATASGAESAAPVQSRAPNRPTGPVEDPLKKRLDKAIQVVAQMPESRIVEASEGAIGRLLKQVQGTMGIEKTAYQDSLDAANEGDFDGWRQQVGAIFEQAAKARAAKVAQKASAPVVVDPKGTPRLNRLRDWFKSVNPDGSKDNYSGLGARESKYVRNLGQTAEASPGVYRAALLAATPKAQAAVAIATAHPVMKAALQKSGLNLADFYLWGARDRLMGLRDRWNGLADQAEAMTDPEDIKEAMDDEYMGGLLQKIQGKRHIAQDVHQTAVAAAQQEDWDAWSKFVARTFRDAADAVDDSIQEMMPDGLYAQRAADPNFQEALRVYRDRIATPMADDHARNDGVFSTALGPSHTYFPLIPADRSLVSGPGRRIPWRKPRNQFNQFATGLSEEYLTTPEALKQRLTAGMRANTKAALIKATDAAGLSLPPTSVDENGNVTWRGVKYPASPPEEVSPARTIIQNGKVIHTRATMRVFPAWFHAEMKPILEGKKFDEAEFSKITSVLMFVTLSGPAEAAFHMANLTGAMVSNTPFLGTSLSDKAISVPIAKRIGVIAKVIFTDPTTDEAAKDLQEMAKIGVIPSRYGSVTYTKKYAEELGAQQKRLTLAPLLFGPEGFDIRARLLMYRLGKAMAAERGKTATAHELNTFVNQLGNYTSQLQGSIERTVKSWPFTQFYTAGSTMIRNGLNSIAGTSPTPGGNSWKILGWKLLAGMVGTVAIWAALHEILSGDLPWKDPRSKFLSWPVGGNNGLFDEKVRRSWIGRRWWGDGPESGYIGMGFFNPLVARAGRAIGAADAYNTAIRRGTAGQDFESAERDILNTWASPMIGPPLRFATVTSLGVEPYLTDFRSRSGSIEPHAMPAIPPNARPGLPTLERKAAAATFGLNAFYNNVGEATGLSNGVPLRGAMWLRMITDLVTPGLFQNASSPEAQSKVIQEQQSVYNRPEQGGKKPPASLGPRHSTHQSQYGGRSRY